MEGYFRTYGFYRDDEPDEAISDHSLNIQNREVKAAPAISLYFFKVNRFFLLAAFMVLSCCLYNKCKKIKNRKIDLYHLFNKCAVLAISVSILIVFVQEKLIKEKA